MKEEQSLRHYYKLIPPPPRASSPTLYSREFRVNLASHDIVLNVYLRTFIEAYMSKYLKNDKLKLKTRQKIIKGEKQEKRGNLV